MLLVEGFILSGLHNCNTAAVLQSCIAVERTALDLCLLSSCTFCGSS